MSRYFISAFGFLIIFISNVSFAYGQQEFCVAKNDAIYRKMTIGYWSDTEEIKIGSKSYIGADKFNADGSFSGIAYNKEDPTDILIMTNGTWEIKNSYLYEYYQLDSSGEMKTSKDKILCMNEHYLRTKAEDKIILEFHKI